MNEWEWQLLEDKRPVESISIHGMEVKPGSRVRLQPRPGGDIMDLALTGKTAVIESVEQDYDGKVHVSVVVDDDPGRDIGVWAAHVTEFSLAALERMYPQGKHGDRS